MGKHILKKGKATITGIASIGKALGYIAIEEFSLDKTRNNSPAVDLAWLSDKDHDFPLMIFEIESKITCAIANNPVKVFGQPNQNLEKPLFFFHVFLNDPKTSSKVDNLVCLFGSYNYRTYNWSEEKDYTRLILDILSQHRRLYRTIDLLNLVSVLKMPVWEKVDLQDALLYIEDHGFATDFLKSYGLLSYGDNKFKNHYLRFLKRYVNEKINQKTPQEYGTHWGDTWGSPIHYAILMKTDPEMRDEYFLKFKKWQKNDNYMSMIGPHLGQSRDYDEFILALAPPFLAFLAALMKDSSESVIYISKQLQIILNKISNFVPKVSFFSAVWLLHIASAGSAKEHFLFAQKFINENGGISEYFLFNPPSSIPLDENEYDDTDEFGRWINQLQVDPIQVPEIDIFQKKVGNKDYDLSDDIIDFALKVLLEPAAHSNWSKCILEHLSS